MPIMSRERREPFKALCYPGQTPEGHSYLTVGVCFADLNRVTFAARNGPGEVPTIDRPYRKTSSEITGAKCARGRKRGRRKLAGQGPSSAASKREERTIRIRRQSAAQMPLGFRSDVSNGSGISMANGTCQILAACLVKGFAKSDGTLARSLASRETPRKN